MMLRTKNEDDLRKLGLQFDPNDPNKLVRIGKLAVGAGSTSNRPGSSTGSTPSRATCPACGEAMALHCGACGHGYSRDEENQVIDAQIVRHWTDAELPTSQRGIAAALPKFLSADHKRVGRRLKELQSSGALPHLERTTGLDGRQRRTKKPDFAKPVQLPAEWKERYELISGEAQSSLSKLPDGYVDNIVTSVPYFRQRDYGHNKQIGIEETVQQYIEKLVAVFQQAQRVLANDGTCWVNIGDKYAGSGGANQRPALPSGNCGLPAKNLCLAPEQFVIAMQKAGWIVRARITWEKTSGYPSSAQDRPASASEMIYMFVKSARYYYGVCGGKSSAAVQCRGEDAPVDIITDVWRISPDQACSTDHPAPMPLKLAERCVRLGCRPGGRVLDPFAGGCTTGVAALAHGRMFTGIDLRREYLMAGEARLRRNFGGRSGECGGEKRCAPGEPCRNPGREPRREPPPKSLGVAG